MATRIVFDSGGELVVAEDEAEVIRAIRRDHPNPVTLESESGGPLHVNWDHVAYIAEVLAGPEQAPSVFSGSERGAS